MSAEPSPGNLVPVDYLFRSFPVSVTGPTVRWSSLYYSSGWDGVNEPTQTVLVPFSTLERSPTHRVARTRGIAVVLYLQYSLYRQRQPSYQTCPTINTSLLTNHLTCLHRPIAHDFSGFSWLIPHARHERQCRPSHSIGILPCKVVACLWPVPMLARMCRIDSCLPCSLSNLCMYAFNLVGLSGDPIFMFPNAYVVYDSVNYTCPGLVQ